MSRKLGLVVATVALSTVASAAVAGDGGEGGTATTVSKYALSPATFAVSKSSKIKITTDKAADVRFTVKLRGGGRKEDGECVERSRENAGKSKCDLELDHPLVKRTRVGANSFSWNGKLDGDELRPGSYWLISSVLSDGGRTNPDKRAAFKVVR